MSISFIRSMLHDQVRAEVLAPRSCCMSMLYVEAQKTIFSGLTICKMALSDQSDLPSY
jgi:hypothetical protein